MEIKFKLYFCPKLHSFVMGEQHVLNKFVLQALGMLIYDIIWYDVWYY